MERNKNLISVSGNIGSGKDTVGQIIQQMTTVVNPPGIVFTYQSPYEIKKFAGKLKQMVCLLTGCTMEQLESQEFKDSKLGSQWDYVWSSYYGSDSYSGQAKSLHTAFTECEREGFLWRTEYIQEYTYRKFLQVLGTNAMRQVVHEDVWVNALFADYRNFHTDKFSVRQGITKPEYPKWIITDTRFPNELRAVESLGGITIRVERDGLPTNNHESETALDRAKFDYVINNNGTMRDLEKRVAEILKEEEII